MIAGDSMEPVAEVAHFILQQVFIEPFEYFYYGILAFCFASQVIHADGKGKVTVAVKKNLNTLLIARDFEVSNEFAVGFGIIGFWF